jgi:hypothetical protein
MPGAVTGTETVTFRPDLRLTPPSQAALKRASVRKRRVRLSSNRHQVATHGLLVTIGRHTRLRTATW